MKTVNPLTCINDVEQSSCNFSLNLQHHY